MTRAAIKKAFEEMGSADQAEMLAELAAVLARSLVLMDEQDSGVFRERRSEEYRASVLRDAARRLRSDGM